MEQCVSQINRKFPSSIYSISFLVCPNPVLFFNKVRPHVWTPFENAFSLIFVVCIHACSDKMSTQTPLWTRIFIGRYYSLKWDGKHTWAKVLWSSYRENHHTEAIDQWNYRLQNGSQGCNMYQAMHRKASSFTERNCSTWDRHVRNAFPSQN